VFIIVQAKRGHRKYAVPSLTIGCTEQ